MLIISRTSKQYVKVPVKVRKNGSPFDPTADTVQMAFGLNNELTHEEGQPTAFLAASWEIDDGVYLARCMVGPGGTIDFTNAPGEYTVYVKVTDNPEVPVIRSGLLLVR